jgi:hypothetical protein
MAGGAIIIGRLRIGTVTVVKPITATTKARNIARVSFTLGSDLYKERNTLSRVPSILQKLPAKLCRLLGPDFYRRHIALDA